MSSETESLHFETVGQLQTALLSSMSYGINPRALSLLDFVYNRIKTDEDVSVYQDIYLWSDSNFAGVKRDIIESVIAAANDIETMPYLSIAAVGLLDYIRTGATTAG